MGFLNQPPKQKRIGEKVKVTNGDIFRTREALPKLMDEKFPVMVSYRLAKLAEKIDTQLRVIEKTRNSLVLKYGKGDERGRNVKVEENSEKFNQFLSEFNELMAVELTLDVEPVRLPEKVAGTCSQCHHNLDRTFEIEPSTLLALSRFIEVDHAG